MMRYNKKTPGRRILAVHLLNDLSGSPLVFSQALTALRDQYDIHLFTATPSGVGFLSGISGVRTHRHFYRWSRNRYLTLAWYLCSQLFIFLRLLCYARRSDIIYINSLLPFGAAWAGRARGCRIVYHIHEVSIRPAALRKWLLKVAGWTSDCCVHVSEYAQEHSPKEVAGTVIYNALPLAFVSRAQRFPHRERHAFSVLMICSLKRYKGVDQFLACARSIPEIGFDLVLNATSEEIDRYMADRSLPQNLICHPATADVHSFYEEASLVINLSQADEWIETFGMTILEGMHYGRPAIVPAVGGITELVQNGITGLCLDTSDVPLIVAAIRKLAVDKELYERMKKASLARAAVFSHDQFNRGIIGVMTRMNNFYDMAPAGELPKKKVAIIGTAGIPARYGGFETLAEHLVRQIGGSYAMTVYCTKKKYRPEERVTRYLDAALLYLPFDANGISSIFYDCFSILHAMFYADVLLVLGVSGGIMLPFVRWFSRKKLIVSIDGIEWKREKWSRPARWYLWWAERIAVRYSHADISDNESIQDYTAIRYKTLSNIIEYGADHTMSVQLSPEYITQYPFLAKPYAFKVCRIEPENNIQMVLEAFSKIGGLPLVLIGNWNNSEYGRRLKQLYGNLPGLVLLDPIYDQGRLDMIRGNAYLYVHGHGAGGTNPSLVEAMYLGLPVVAFGVSYNKTTTEQKAWYFTSSNDLIRIVSGMTEAERKNKADQMKEIARRRYNWSIIAEKYSSLIRQVLATDRKVSVRPITTDMQISTLLDLEIGHLANPSYFYDKR